MVRPGRARRGYATQGKVTFSGEWSYEDRGGNAQIHSTVQSEQAL